MIRYVCDICRRDLGSYEHLTKDVFAVSICKWNPSKYDPKKVEPDFRNQYIDIICEDCLNPVLGKFVYQTEGDNG